MTLTRWTEPSVQRKKWRNLRDWCQLQGSSEGPGVWRTYPTSLLLLIPTWVAIFCYLCYIHVTCHLCWTNIYENKFCNNMTDVYVVLSVKHQLSSPTPGSQDQQDITPSEPESQVISDTHTHQPGPGEFFWHCCVVWICGATGEWTSSGGLSDITWPSHISYHLRFASLASWMKSMNGVNESSILLVIVISLTILLALSSDNSW